MLHGCAVHVDRSYVVGGCNLIATEHGRCGPFFRYKKERREVGGEVEEKMYGL